MQVEGRLPAAAETALWTDLANIGCQNQAGGSKVTGPRESAGDPRVLRPGRVTLAIECKPQIRPLLIGRIIKANVPASGFTIRVGGWMTSERVTP